MEDAICALLKLPVPMEKFMMFAVFDGHGGFQVSRRVAQELPKVTAECAASLKEESKTLHGEEALRLALPSMDALLREDGEKMRHLHRELPIGHPARRGKGSRNAFELVGSTAIVVLLEHAGGSTSSEPSPPQRVVAANCGDSRAILCWGGKALELSEDHKPELPSERRRIEAAGGSVTQNGPCHRVDGWGLNLSRALGDFYYKGRNDLPAHEQKVIAVPEIRSLELTPEDEFLFLGCDGVFELFSSQEAIDHVRRSLQSGKTPEQAAEALVEQCCSPNLFKTQGRGGDNISCIIVVFKRPCGTSGAASGG